MTVRRQLLVVCEPPIKGAGPIIIQMSSGPNPIVGVPVGSTPANAITVVATGGVPPYAFSIVSGSLPPGLTMASNGKITGTPTTQGHYAFIVGAQDGASQAAPPRSFALNVESGLFNATPTPPPIGERTVAYDFPLRVRDASGSSAGITFSLASGTLPAGVTISSGGLLSGTPTASGYSYPTIRAARGALSIDIPLKIQINEQFSTAGMIAELSDGLKNMSVGVRTQGTISLRWPFATMPVGVAPYLWRVSAGALPPGLIMMTNGTIKGTPSAPTPPNYVQPTFTLTDSIGATLSFQLSGPNVLQVATPIVNPRPYEFVVASSSGSLGTIPFASLFFSAGQDGDAVLNGSNDYPWATRSGLTYQLTRDVFLRNLTMASGAVLNMRNYAIFGSGTVDLTNASASSIRSSATGGGNAISGAGLGGSPGNPFGSLALGSAGGNGSAGVVGTPALPDNAPALPVGAGGGLWRTPNAGSGGTGTGGGPSAPGGVPPGFNCETRYPFPIGPLSTPAGGVGGGIGGAGGGAGAGNGANVGGSGGGGGAGGPSALFAFYEIRTAATTPAGVFAVIAGPGGNGQAVSTATIGGGGGGQGGSGGYFHVRYGIRTGTPIAGLIAVDGGRGGNGGANSANSARNGVGGDGGRGGTVDILNVLSGITTTVSETVAPTVPSGTTGGNGGQTRATL